MIEAVLSALIWIAVLALLIYVVLWILQSVAGIVVPAKVVQIVWVIFALVCLLILARLVLGFGEPVFPWSAQAPRAVASGHAPATVIGAVEVMVTVWSGSPGGHQDWAGDGRRLQRVQELLVIAGDQLVLVVAVDDLPCIDRVVLFGVEILTELLVGEPPLSHATEQNAGGDETIERHLGVGDEVAVVNQCQCLAGIVVVVFPSQLHKAGDRYRASIPCPADTPGSRTR